MLERRKHERVARELLRIILAPSAGEGCGVRVYVTAEGCTVSGVQVGERNCYGDISYGLFGVRRSVQVAYGEIAAMEEPVQCVEDRGLSNAAAPYQCCQVAESDVQVGDTTEAADPDRGDPHSGSAPRALTELAPVASVEPSIGRTPGDELCRIEALVSWLDRHDLCRDQAECMTTARAVAVVIPEVI